MNRIRQCLPQYLLILLLVSCGGGSGGSTTVTPPAPQGQAMTLFVPLYIWPDLNLPNSAWLRVATAQASVPTVAVINPNSGPIQPAPQVFLDGIRTLKNAGVTVLGYVPTGYGTRTEAAIHADMDVYIQQYGLTAFFLDEVETNNTPRFNRLCAHAGATRITLNPGTAVPNNYISAACTQAVIFESSENNWWGHSLSAQNATLAPTTKVALVHTAANDTVSLQTSLNQAQQLGVASIFVTDKPFGLQTWNTLPTYFSSEIQQLGIMRLP